MSRAGRAIPVHRSEGHRLFRDFVQGLNMAEIARRTGVSREMIRKLADGTAGPGIELALRIQEATYGAVPLVTWAQPRKDDEAA
jgi:transcriptional regulator with XRE-family HTH domain